MTLLCFLLDLRSISPPLLRDLKQCLLQLANLYVVSCGRGEREQSADEISLLPDRIGLCYLHKSRSHSSSELKIAYRPGGSFSLRDFHHAVNNLPMESFLPELCEPEPTGIDDQDVTLAELLNREALYTWGGEDILKKVIAIGSTSFTNSDTLRKCLMDAAERCVTVEFVVLEPVANQYHEASEKFQGFINSIYDLENCVLRRYLPDTWVLCGLVKGWLQELKNDLEELLQAVFLFNNSIMGSTNKISCNLFASTNQIIDGFASCQTCRCHGYPISTDVGNKAKSSYCSLSSRKLGASDLIQNAVRVGEQTVLFLPSFEGCPKLRRISEPITFNVIERTNLASLNEGVIVGTSYVVVPSACHEMEGVSDECDNPELNIQLFHGLCSALFLLDQALVCSSTCNTETMRDGIFQCFYILQPSDRGAMLLRRLAGSEEILPFPDLSRSNDLAIPAEIENSIQASLAKVELRDYNPLLHERGFHPKLNWLVKESLQFGSIPPHRVETNPKLRIPPQLQASILQQPSTTRAPEEEMYLNQNNEEKASSCVSDEWEQLLILDEMKKTSSCVSEEWEQLFIVHERNKSYSPTCISKSNFQNSILSPQLQASILQQPSTTRAPEEEMHSNQNNEEKASSCVSEEWEQLLILDEMKKASSCVSEEWEQLQIVHEMNKSYSPTCISKPNFQNSTLSPQTKPLDEKTSRILERLEAPKQQNSKRNSPATLNNAVSGQMKKPLLPFGSTSSQPLKPNFARQKKKQR